MGGGKGEAWTQIRMCCFLFSVVSHLKKNFINIRAAVSNHTPCHFAIPPAPS